MRIQVRPSTETADSGLGAGHWWWVITGGLLLAAIVIGLIIAPTSNEGFPDAAAVLSFATLAAVGIERMLEIAWTVVDHSRLGAYWPMSVIRQHQSSGNR